MAEGGTFAAHTQHASSVPVLLLCVMYAVSYHTVHTRQVDSNLIHSSADPNLSSKLCMQLRLLRLLVLTAFCPTGPSVCLLSH